MKTIPDLIECWSAASFGINEDSLVALSDRMGKLELEVAAEAFTAKVFDEE